MIGLKRTGVQTGGLVLLFLLTLIYISPVNILNPTLESNLSKDSNTTIVRFKLEHCNCERTLEIFKNENEPLFNSTTCGMDAFRRGSHQRTIGFSFYGDPRTPRHKSKQYFQGISENLNLLPRFYPGWTMRLYYDLAPNDPLLVDLCSLACKDSNMDLCYVKNLPGVPMKDATKVFAMNWRFFPTLDPQVRNLPK